MGCGTSSIKHAQVHPFDDHSRSNCRRAAGAQKCKLEEPNTFTKVVTGHVASDAPAVTIGTPTGNKGPVTGTSQNPPRSPEKAKASTSPAVKASPARKSSSPIANAPAAPTSSSPASKASSVPQKDSAAADEVKAVKAVAADEPLTVELVPIHMFIEDMEPLFQAYIQRLSPSISQTLDCSWERLEAEIGKARRLADLEWYWLCSSSDANRSNADIARSAVGLVVFRVVRGAMSNHGQVCHLSVVGEQWRPQMERVLATVKETILRTCPVGSLRISLWYSYNEEGQYKLDPTIESMLKASGWRWFQLTNTADGKRGQIMVYRRNPEMDSPEPRQVMDLSLSSCLIMGSACKEPQGQRPCHSNAGSAAAALLSNPLVLAECIRRQRALADAEGGAEQQALSEAQEPESLVAELLRAQRPPTKLVITKDAAEREECKEFTDRCTVHVDDVDGPSVLGRVMEGLQVGEDQRALCGGLSLSLDWKESWASPSDADHIRVAVHARGSRAEAEDTQATPSWPSEVLYLATEDEDVFVMVWQLPSALDSSCGQQVLYKHCREVVKSMPPKVIDVDEVGASPCVELPRLAALATPSTHLPQSAEASPGKEAQELVAVNLAVRPERLCVLQSKASHNDADREVVNFKNAFVFCVWHTSLDELEVPMFLSVITP
eukprot:CAMPEP_0178389924 /NCGR_PEP_ID=MMETSP0689_2-20121128/10379_1 /TAXON_ID=160604 /ORGANISM="Amphidinium massartii, Strain CS-259" /LENGTH=663 /DNA_ID=CAMNT_0020010413 /DNA_START=6 /DNA_END=2000 /DNA_ORIENTATION=+